VIIAFDLMQTLLTDPYRDAHEAATGLSWAEFEGRRPDGVYHSLELGEIAESKYWQALRDAGIAVDAERFHRTRRAGYRWLPGMRELLVDCAAHGRVVVASNYPVWIDDVKPGAFGAQGVHVHASCRLGARKPDARFFAALAGCEGVTVRELVLVDDVAANVEGIERAGGTGIAMTGADPVRDALVRLGALPSGARPPAPHRS
jgi:HAD superfamily hydrolase (TIGR01509 family)